MTPALRGRQYIAERNARATVVRDATDSTIQRPVLRAARRRISTTDAWRCNCRSIKLMMLPRSPRPYNAKNYLGSVCVRTILVLFVSLLSASVQAQGNSCDCQQYTSACEASINVVPATSTKGSYGADLRIRSTAPQCSKVDYYVDGTPYFTILSQGNQGEDRVFGQKPITSANISSISCHVCRQESENTVPGSEPNVRGGSQVTLLRPDGEVGAAVTNQLLVDGKPVGSLGNGQSLSVDLPAGAHTLKNIRMYQGAWQGECSQSIQVDGVASYRYEVALVRLVGTTATSANEASCRFVAQ